MQNIGEWIKGFMFSLLFGIAFYLLWDNIFFYIINLASTWTVDGSLTSNSLGLLTSLAWISFVLLYIGCVPLYFLVTTIRGTTPGDKTNPLYLFKAIGVWSISIPFALVIYLIISFLIQTMDTATTGLMSDPSGLASTISWFITFGVIFIMNFIPGYYILKAYGLMGGENEE